MRYGVLVIAGLLLAGSAGAQELPCTPEQQVKEFAGAPYAVAEEHVLTVVESGRCRPISEDLEKAPEWEWPRKHLAAGRSFADPFLGPEIYPELSAGLSAGAAHIRPRGVLSYRDTLDLNLYLLQLRIPMAAGISGTRGQLPIEASLRIPFAWPGAPQHRLALALEALVQRSGPALSQSSRMQLMYGLGLGGFSFQARAGYGHEQLYPEEPMREGLLYGALVGWRVGAIQPLVELDALRTNLTRSNRLTLVPGVRIFPGGLDQVQFGAGALLGFGGGGDAPARRYGGILDVSYNFL